jgi:hypothetical protein
MVDRSTRGEQFLVDAVKEFVFSAPKMEILRECASLLDEIDGLTARLAEEGPVVRATGLSIKEHPASTALRSNRRLLANLLRLLDFPDEEE